MKINDSYIFELCDLSLIVLEVHFPSIRQALHASMVSSYVIQSAVEPS